MAVFETFWAISRTLRPRGEYCRNIFRGPGSGKILQHYSSGGKNIGQFFPHLYLVANGIMHHLSWHYFHPEINLFILLKQKWQHVSFLPLTLINTLKLLS